MTRRAKTAVVAIVVLLIALVPGTADAQSTETGMLPIPSDALPWWMWPILLFAFTLVLGVVAVIGGVGGGVLFVPIVAAVFPFHFDFVRGAGLVVALCGALSAAPRLLRSSLASIRLAIPMAVFGSVGSVFGARLGLALPTSLVQSLLGAVILAIVVLMLLSNNTQGRTHAAADRYATLLNIRGAYTDPTEDRPVQWAATRVPLALVSFLAIGVLAGMFGLGAGWANVPALNLLVGVPMKLAVGTSGFIITMTAPAAAWVYITSGAVLPLIAVPSVVGMMIGTRAGAALLPRVKASVVRWVVVGMLLVAGLRSAIVGLQALIG
jgi:uncharacterized protein